MEKQNNLFGVENQGEWMPPPRFVIEFYIKLTPCGAVVSTRGGYNGQPPTLAHTKKCWGLGPKWAQLDTFNTSDCLGITMATLYPNENSG